MSDLLRALRHLTETVEIALEDPGAEEFFGETNFKIAQEEVKAARAALAAVPPPPDLEQRPVGGNAAPSSPSVDSSVAEPTDSAVVHGFESASDFEDSRLCKLLSGCRGAALRARITWRAMNEDRHVEVDEWWRMLTDADWESLGEISDDDDDESFAEYQARISATETRTLGDSGQVMAGRDVAQNGAAVPSTPDQNDLLGGQGGRTPAAPQPATDWPFSQIKPIPNATPPAADR